MFKIYLSIAILIVHACLRHDDGDGRYAEHAMVEDLLLAQQGVRAGLCRTHRYHSGLRPEKRN